MTLKYGGGKVNPITTVCAYWAFRKEMNKQAAKLFRVRQRSKLEELEKQLEDLKVLSVDYQYSIELLSHENRVLSVLRLGESRSAQGARLII